MTASERYVRRRERFYLTLVGKLKKKKKKEKWYDVCDLDISVLGRERESEN